MIDDVVLEELRLCLIQRISRHLFDVQVDVAVGNDPLLADYIEARVSGWLASERVQEHRVIYPADWWQAFKQRWFPAWAQQRWPVRYSERVFRVMAVYPDFRPSLPKQRYVFFGDVHNAAQYDE